MQDIKRVILTEAKVVGLNAMKLLGRSFGVVAAKATKADKATTGATKATKDAGRAAGRARMDLGDLATSFRDMGDFGTRAGDVIDQFSVITRGPMGLAVAGAVAGIAGLTVGFAGLKAAVEAGITTNRKANRSFKALVTEGKRFVAVLGQIIIGGNEGASAIDSMTGKLQDFTKTLIANAVPIRDTMISIAQAAVSAVKFVGTGLLGIKAVFVGLGKLIAELSINLIAPFADTIGRQVGALLSKLRELVMKFAGFMRDQGKDAGPLYEMANALSATADTARRFGVEVKAAAGTAVVGAGFSGELQKIDAFRQKLDGVNASLERMKGRKVTIDTKGINDSLRTGGGGGKEDFVGVSDDVIELERSRRQRRYQGNRTQAELDLLKRKAAALSEINVQEKVAFEMGRKLGEQISGELSSAFVGLASSVGQAIGAFAAGEGTLKAFGDQVADLFGNLASTIGQFFIQTGAGMIFLNPATGLGLIGAGVALSAVGGAISSKGSANSGRSAGASARRQVERQVERTFGGQSEVDRQARPQVLLIGDREFTGYLHHSVADARRRGVRGFA